MGKSHVKPIRLSRKATIRVALTMALALLCAQWAAQTHAYRHLSSKAVATHQLDPKAQLCSDCLSFAPLLSTATGNSLPAVPASLGVDPAPANVFLSLIGGEFPAAFRSRAPPYSR